MRVAGSLPPTCGSYRPDLFDAAVARDGVVGSAIAHDGTITTDGAWITALIAALDEIEWQKLHVATHTASIALVASRADSRVALASNLLDPMTPVLSELFGLGPAGAAELGEDDDARAHRRWFAAIERGLTRAGVHVEIVDEGVSEEMLARHAMVIVPTMTRVDRALWKRLRALAEHKRLVVIAGPGAPTLDELGTPLGEDATPPRRLGRLRAESLDARGNDAGLDADLADLATAHVTARAEFALAEPRTTTLTSFADDADRVRAVFIINVGAESARAQVVAAPGLSLRDPFTGARIRTTAPTTSVTMPAHSARMFVVD